MINVLAQTPASTDAQVNKALQDLPVIPDNVLVVLRAQQAAIAALTARVLDLETP